MKVIAVAQWVVRLCGLVALLFGILLWIENHKLMPLHMLLGFILVIGLWTLSVMALITRLYGLGIAGIVWGLVVVGLGNAQMSIMPGASHWVIRVVHLIVGLAAIGLAETIAKRARVARSAAVP